MEVVVEGSFFRSSKMLEVEDTFLVEKAEVDSLGRDHRNAKGCTLGHKHMRVEVGELSFGLDIAEDTAGVIQGESQTDLEVVFVVEAEGYMP